MNDRYMYKCYITAANRIWVLWLGVGCGLLGGRGGGSFWDIPCCCFCCCRCFSERDLQIFLSSSFTYWDMTFCCISMLLLQNQPIRINPSPSHWIQLIIMCSRFIDLAIIVHTCPSPSYWQILIIFLIFWRSGICDSITQHSVTNNYLS